MSLPTMAPDVDKIARPEGMVSTMDCFFQSPNRYDNPANSNPDSRCFVTVLPLHYHLALDKEKTHLAIASEIAHNDGMSVTNSWEVLGPQIAQGFGFAHGSVKLVEHYGPFSYAGNQDEEERFAVLNYEAPKGGPRKIYAVTGWNFLDSIKELQARER